MVSPTSSSGITTRSSSMISGCLSSEYSSRTHISCVALISDPHSSGEFHTFRLPVPDLWLDIFQKMVATGLNAVRYV